MFTLFNTKLASIIRNKINVSEITEIRLRLGKPILIKTVNDICFLDYFCDEKTINDIVDKATEFSRYAYEYEMTNGYLPYKNGIRIGVVGDVKLTDKGVFAYKKIFALCIRLPKEVLGCCKNLVDIIKNFKNTLILSPPYGGKTTLIREMARLLSENFDTLIIDERYEICGYNAELKRGDRCDVLQGISKSLVFEGVLRAMSPQIIVCDELYGEKETIALERITQSGIMCLATYHSAKIQDIPINLRNIFDNFIVLTSKPTVGSIASIIKS